MVTEQRTHKSRLFFSKTSVEASSRWVVAVQGHLCSRHRCYVIPFLSSLVGWKPRVCSLPQNSLNGTQKTNKWPFRILKTPPKIIWLRTCNILTSPHHLSSHQFVNLPRAQWKVTFSVTFLPRGLRWKTSNKEEAWRMGTSIWLCPRTQEITKLLEHFRIQDCRGKLRALLIRPLKSRGCSSFKSCTIW